jgi:serine/threonine protein kinase
LTLAPIESDNHRVSRAAAEVGSTANSYQILAKLATGGMAEIFLARGEGVAGVERYCVLKRILRDRASDVHFVRMFLDEARLAAQLQHANIAQVYDIGKLGDSYFFTMEYVHGETVRALLHRAQGLRRKLPINCVLTIAAGTAAGLHHAHARLGFDGRALDIVHRDVSPSNLMVSYEGGVKVVDFGVAKAADRAQETKSGTVKGKISYLSPEQCKGKRVDRRSDLFSLGICFWEMLTTERLFKRASDFENMNAIVTESTPPPSSRRPDVPPEIDELVLRLLAKSPDDRFQTADELVDALEGVAARTSTVLSASALGRFVRELFGQRPEPWLELEGQHEHGEAVTVTSEPIPRELAIQVAEEVNLQLSSVLDLSAPPSMTESLDSVPLDLPTAKLGKRPALGFPLAAPPPTHPRIARPSPAPSATSPLSSARTTASLSSVSSVSSVSPSESLEAYTLSSDELAAPPTAVGSRSALLAAPVAAAVPSSGPRSVSFVAPADSALPLPAPPSASFAVPSGPQVTPSGRRSGSVTASQDPHPRRSGPHATPTGPRSSAFAAPSGVHPTPSGLRSSSFVAPSGPRSASLAAPSGSQPAMRASGSYSTPTRRRSGWPLYAVIGSAALLGSIAVMVMMRSSAGAMVVDAASATRPPEPTITPLEPAPAPAPAPAVEPPVAPRARPVIRDATAGEVAAVRAAQAGSMGTSAAAAAPSAATAVPKPTASERVPARPSVRPPPSPRTAEPPITISAAEHPSGKRESSDDEIGRSYKAGQYEQVVALCSAGPVSAEHAPMCFLAACHAGNEAKARKLITAVSPARRDQLTSNCQQLGVDIGGRKKPDKPASDCETDPMACQH